MKSLLPILFLLCLAADDKPAEKPAEKAPRAARSVHLRYLAPEGVAFYNEATVEQSTRGSYFCAAGFGHGYFGIQELGNGKKVVLFSVWDPGPQNDPKSVPADRRVEVLYQNPDIRVGRFGGEGTGAQSFLDYDWKIGETVRFLIRAKPTEDKTKTAYSAYFYRNEPAGWVHMATFQTLTKGEALKGYYSFVEDFRRDGKSPGEVRKARYENGLVQTAAGEWLSLTRAKFTGDSTPLNNIDAGDTARGFYLATGGELTSSHPLNSTLNRPPTPVGLPE